MVFRGISRKSEADGSTYGLTVSHDRSKQDVVQSVDGSFDDLFRGPGFIPLEIGNQQRSWNGSVMTFSFEAKGGLKRHTLSRLGRKLNLRKSA